jgi:hypothetical protein
MMSGVPLETCWAFNERWNNKLYYKVASCWLFLLKKLIVKDRERSGLDLIWSIFLKNLKGKKNWSPLIVSGQRIQHKSSWIASTNLSTTVLGVLFYCQTLYYGSVSSVGIAIGYGLDFPGIESRRGRDFPHLSRPDLRPTQPPVQWVPCLSRG